MAGDPGSDVPYSVRQNSEYIPRVRMYNSDYISVSRGVAPVTTSPSFGSPGNGNNRNNSITDNTPEMSTLGSPAGFVGMYTKPHNPQHHHYVVSTTQAGGCLSQPVTVGNMHIIDEDTREHPNVFDSDSDNSLDSGEFSFDNESLDTVDMPASQCWVSRYRRLRRASILM